MLATKSGKPLNLVYTKMQDAVFTDAHRYVILAKGRRAGGTRGAAQHAIERLLSGDKKVAILWVDTIQANLSRYYERYFLPLLSQLNNQLWEWNESKKLLKILGGYMDMRSAEKPENIEGFGYSDIIMNEAGIILNDRSLWDVTIRPMALDQKAKCFFVGTPKGKRDKTGQKHLFLEFYERGKDPEHWPEWKSYQYSSYQNPFLDKEEIKKLEAEVPAIVAQQEIKAEFIDISEDMIFRPEWWRYEENVPSDINVKLRLLSLDTAFKVGETNDYSAGTVWYKTHNTFYIVDAFRGRWTFPDLIDKVKDYYTKWRVDLVLIEDRASGQSLIQMLQSQSNLPVAPYSPDKDKVSRAVAITPFVKNGQVVLIKGSWNKMLTDELGVFPNGEYDDLCDSFSQALNYSKLSVGFEKLRPVVTRSVVHDEFDQYNEPIPGDYPQYPDDHSGVFHGRSVRRNNILEDFQV